MGAVDKIGVHKKRERAIEKVKRNIEKIIDDAKNSKNYERCFQVFENLFNSIVKAVNDN